LVTERDAVFWLAVEVGLYADTTLDDGIAVAFGTVVEVGTTLEAETRTVLVGTVMFGATTEDCTAVVADIGVVTGTTDEVGTALVTGSTVELGTAVVVNTEVSTAAVVSAAVVGGTSVVVGTTVEDGTTVVVCT